MKRLLPILLAVVLSSCTTLRPAPEETDIEFIQRKAMRETQTEGTNKMTQSPDTAKDVKVFAIQDIARELVMAHDALDLEALVRELEIEMRRVEKL